MKLELSPCPATMICAFGRQTTIAASSRSMNNDFKRISNCLNYRRPLLFTAVVFIENFSQKQMLCLGNFGLKGKNVKTSLFFIPWKIKSTDTKNANNKDRRHTQIVRVFLLQICKHFQYYSNFLNSEGISGYKQVKFIIQ